MRSGNPVGGFFVAVGVVIAAPFIAMFAGGEWLYVKGNNFFVQKDIDARRAEVFEGTKNKISSLFVLHAKKNITLEPTISNYIDCSVSAIATAKAAMVINAEFDGNMTAVSGTSKLFKRERASDLSSPDPQNEYRNTAKYALRQCFNGLITSTAIPLHSVYLAKAFEKLSSTYAGQDSSFSDENANEEIFTPITAGLYDANSSAKFWYKNGYNYGGRSADEYSYKAAYVSEDNEIGREFRLSGVNAPDLCLVDAAAKAVANVYSTYSQQGKSYVLNARDVDYETGKFIPSKSDAQLAHNRVVEKDLNVMYTKAVSAEIGRCEKKYSILKYSEQNDFPKLRYLRYALENGRFLFNDDVYPRLFL